MDCEQDETMINRNTAPYPDDLAFLLQHLKYKENWRFFLQPELDRGQGSVGLTLTILITTPNSYDTSKLRIVAHYFPVPPAAYDVGSWQRWLFDQILLVERHEAMEFFQIYDRRPYAPHHGPGRDPYMIVELGTQDQVNTLFTGEIKGENNESSD